MVFCNWLLSLSVMSSRFIHVLACIRTSLLLPGNSSWNGETAFYLSIHPLMDICVVSTFWVLWTVPIWVFLCTFLCGYVFSCYIPRRKIAGSSGNFTFWGKTVFLKWLHHLIFPPAVYEECNFFTTSQILIFLF